MSNTFNNKKILLICKESFSFPMYFLAQELQKNNDVGAFFVNPMESYLKKNPMNEYTYYKFKSLDGVKVFDLNDQVNIFSKYLNSPPVNWKEIERIEKLYTYYKTLNNQLLTAQMFTKHSHYRFYYQNSTYLQQLYWLQLNYLKIESLIDEFKPDVILDLDNSEMQRSIIAEISNFKKLPYLVLFFPRIEDYKIPSFSTEWNNNYFRKFYYNVLNSEDSLFEEINYIKSFRERDKIMSIEFKNQITSQFKRNSIIRVLKNILTRFIYIIKVDIISGNIFLRQKNKILFHSSRKYLKFIILTELKRWYLFGSNIFFKKPDLNQNYVLMTLHLIPESSTFVLSPFFIDELHCIKQISKSLPSGWLLYVKEHQVMVGERSLDFYKKVNQLGNVKMVQFNYYDDPKPWILNSKGVITITGTVAYEAALLGKKALVFGNIPFDLMSSIKKVFSYEELPKLISSFSDDFDNTNSCAAYIKSVKECGTQVPINYLQFEAESIIKNESEISEVFKNSILSLKAFFEKSYNQFYTKVNL